MIKKALATAGLAAAVLGASAPLATAVGDDRVSTQNGNFSTQSYGNTGSEGADTPEGPTRTLERGEGLLRALR
ncbi:MULTISPECIES: hypothetical protein [unclassified Streptomyces]|uniref:hypothetical protein n=1 Tax=unclassified Streptomyces TaxID=2593676 RepID=UPI0008DEA7B1|nr:MULTISPECIES: hypothetical protein [unclassified Streptomyces]OII66523.1 hypothetical protein BJP39_08475 [Streptomyces sp. CC77]